SLSVILLNSFIHLGAFLALTLDWNADNLHRCPSLATVISACTAIFGTLSGFYFVLTLGLFTTLTFHNFRRPVAKKTLALTSIATTGASLVVTCAGIVSLEVVLHSYGIEDPCMATVPYSPSLVIMLFSFLLNAVLFFISLKRWIRRRKEEIVS
ncbi:hypothetical protein PMAYCL1PPCAC_14903, partial [Pristionchus mayeri]